MHSSLQMKATLGRIMEVTIIRVNNSSRSDLVSCDVLASDSQIASACR